jgi:hypothetical protein
MICVAGALAYIVLVRWVIRRCDCLAALVAGYIAALGWVVRIA